MCITRKRNSYLIDFSIDQVFGVSLQTGTLAWQLLRKLTILVPITSDPFREAEVFSSTAILTKPFCRFITSFMVATLDMPRRLISVDLVNNTISKIITEMENLYCWITKSEHCYFQHGTEWPDFLMDQTRRWLGTAVNWTQYSTELLSIHYEDLRKDPRPQLRLILEFLQLPVDERRLDCIEVTYRYLWIKI